MSFSLSATDFMTIGPEIIVVVMGLVVTVIELLSKGRDTRLLAYLTLATFIVAGYAELLLLGSGATAFGGTVVADNFSVAFELIFLTASAFTVLLSLRYLEDRGLHRGEYYALLLFATAGMMVMVSGRDLLLIFVGLEILSMSSYILCGIIQSDIRSNESAMKYFLLGAFATGFLLYGIMLLYGATGSIHLTEIGEALRQNETFANPYIWFGLGFLLVGFGFKVALVPFHMWTPDVYEGAPTAITAFLSTGPKAAGFAALLRILMEALGAAQAEWSQVLWVLAAATMTVGNLLALNQDNIKRMLAYSSIAHAGYILAAMVAGGRDGLAGVVFYSLAYVFMNFGAFAIIILASDSIKERVTFSDYRGFGFSSPLLALAMFIFMLSLAGIPLTAGFAGKFQIFQSLVSEGFTYLAVIGVLNSVVSLFYYLRIVVVMYMEKPGLDEPKVTPSIPVYLAVAGALVGVFYLGIVPGNWLNLSLSSVSQFISG